MVFTLRADATFSDGTPVKASDVVYSFQRLLHNNQGPANLFAIVVKPDAAVAVHAYADKFTFSRIFGPFMATDPALMIANAGVFEANSGADDGQTFLDPDRGAGLNLPGNGLRDMYDVEDVR